MEKHGHPESISGHVREEDRREPQPEVGKEVHHRIENHGRRGMFLAHVLRQFHDTIWFSTQSTYGCGIVQSVTRDGEFEDTHETDMFVEVGIALDDTVPGQCVHAIDEYPYAKNGYEPIAGTRQVLPQLGKADVEGKHHDHNSHDAYDEKKVIQTLLGPLHSGFELRCLT